MTEKLRKNNSEVSRVHIFLTISEYYLSKSDIPGRGFDSALYFVSKALYASNILKPETDENVLGELTENFASRNIEERIVLICGSGTDTEQFDEMVLANDRPAIRHWLKAQVWYATAAAMEHLQRFWMANFDCLPDLKHNYVVPCFSSILRCLSNGKGFAVIPDFLAKKAIALNSVKLAWEGCPHVENTLHFGKRKKAVYANEIRQLEQILTNNWLQ